MMLRTSALLRPLGWLLAACLLLPACRRAETPVAQGLKDNTLLISVGSEPATLDPHRNTGSPESFIISALWEPLVKWNETATGLVPAAAERWEVSADGRTYTFFLRPDAKWSNGEPVTAQHWVRSLQRWVTPAIAGELSMFADPVKGVLAFRSGQEKDPSTLGFRAVDALTLEIELEAPRVGFLNRLTSYPWLPIHPPSVEAAGGIDNLTADFIVPGRLVSNGPFVLSEWRHDQFVEVRRNPRYHGDVPLDAIRFISMENLDTMERAFRTGQLHVTDGVPASKMETYRAAGNPALVSYPRVGTRYLTFNTTRPPFDDVRVRQAFSMALDRQKLVDVVLRTADTPATGMVQPLADGYQPRVHLQEDVAAARALMAEAGYPEGRDFPPTEYLYNTLDRNRQMAEALQQMWKTALGVDVSLRNEEWKVFLDTRRELNYQVARAGWLPFSAEPLELYELQTAEAGTNETGWTHPEYEEHYATALRTMDRDVRVAHYEAMDRILLEEMPVVPIAHYSRSRLIHPAVRGWATNHLEGLVWTRIWLDPSAVE